MIERFVPGAGGVENVAWQVAHELARQGEDVTVLARESEVLHVRLVASREYRIGLAMHELGLGEAEAAASVDERDLSRARYHKENYGRDWNDPVHYHVVLNTELLGTDGAADLVTARARALGW